MIKAGFDLSERHKCYVMLRSYTRLSHGSSLVEIEQIRKSDRKAYSDTNVCVTPYLAKPKHSLVLRKLEEISQEFEQSRFNEYQGPEKPEVVIVASGSGVQCTLEAIELLGLESSVGLLKLGTLWPFPSARLAEH